MFKMPHYINYFAFKSLINGYQRQGQIPKVFEEDENETSQTGEFEQKTKEARYKLERYRLERYKIERYNLEVYKLERYRGVR